MTHRPDSTPPPSAPMPGPQRHPDPGAGYYVLAVLMPLFGIILGIQAAARSQTGPALALWATSLFIGPTFWIVFWTMLALGSAS